MICPLAARLILAELPAACWHGSATTAEPPICFTFSWTTLEEIAASSVASLTGCVACQNVPVTAYVDGKLETVTEPSAPEYGQEPVSETDCPDQETGCVVCQKVPVTGVVGMVAMLTGCVACQNVPLTGTVPETETAGELVTFTETLPLESTFASRTHGLPLHPVP